MIFETDSIQSYLQQEFSRRVRLNSRYSLRAYSRSIGISSGALSEILRGRRPLTLKAARAVASSLGLNAAETKRLYELVEADRRTSLGQTEDPSSIASQVSQRQLDLDTFQVISEWQHFAILNLLDCEGFRWSANWISKRLGLGVAQAKLAMDLLVKLGLVEKSNGSMRCREGFVLSPTGVSSTALREYHRQILTKATDALELQSRDERDVTGIGFAVDPRRLPQIKKEISDFQDLILAKYSKGKRHEVYFLEMALFRLTQGDRDVDV